MKKALCCTVILAMFCLAAPLQAPASKPVLMTLTGCVINGTLFSVRQGSPGQAKILVNPIRMNPKKKVNLAPYEGKKIQVKGYLSPNLFTPDLKTLKVLGPCDRESQEAINQDKR